jgi:hypothetical protein
VGWLRLTVQVKPFDFYILAGGSVTLDLEAATRDLERSREQAAAEIASTISDLLRQPLASEDGDRHAQPCPASRGEHCIAGTRR